MARRLRHLEGILTNTTAHEAARQTVNTLVSTNTGLDALIDFDAVVRNPITLTNLLPPTTPAIICI